MIAIRHDNDVLAGLNAAQSGVIQQAACDVVRFHDHITREQDRESERAIAWRECRPYSHLLVYRTTAIFAVLWNPCASIEMKKKPEHSPFAEQ